mgnify:CR=1 FL=1
MSSLPSKFSLAECLHRLSSWSKGKHVERVEHKKNTSVMMQMYYDSELGSSIEQHLEKTLASASYNSIKSFLPKWKLTDNVAKFLGNRIAHRQIKKMDQEKLKYQFCKGYLSEDKYIKESSKRFVTSTVTFVNNSWPLVNIGLKKGSEAILIGFGVDIETAKKVSTWIVTGVNLVKKPVTDFLKENKVKEKTENFVYKTTKNFVDNTRKLVNYVDEKIDKAREKTKEFVDNVSQKLGYDSFSDFKQNVKESAKEFANKVIDSVATVATKVSGFIGGLLKK